MVPAGITANGSRRGNAFLALGGSGAKISLSSGVSIARHCSPVKSGRAHLPPHRCSSW